MPRSRVTLKDVAAASGVSATTASFVLNRVTGQTIPPATQERVRRAAAELGYVPHGSARALREGSSRLVLLNVGELPVAGSLRSFIAGLDAELAAHEHTLLVRHGRTGDATLRRAVETADPRAVIDLVKVYAADDPDRLDGGWIDGLATHTATQIDYLAGRGHTRIGFAMPSDDRLARIARLRLQQARTVARTRGLPAPAEFTLDDFVAAAGTITAVATFDGHAQARVVPPVAVPDGHAAVTAVAAFDDDTALRLLSAMADRGLHAPDDLAVIGFDDTGHGGFWRPALTTVRIDAEGYGRRAARAVLGLPTDAAPPAPSTVIVRSTA
ncbi:LacI family transcriptional regulator [Actinoplanes italicus]|uniref:LacI family transcriptional regulator n=1 Tax=Actinoplanes italicus TaxID=113567 RepID=A0A2T0K3H9_9ACTN|nr:LacI family DNA-binding transcriptional regulator [Actinoplanes italicus]PRX17412.1 LacI family transcriptional regulator [Actinoplanes italicus]GIE30337.1 LacI family transcriptional regulator [Actinoplanes italicus]